MSTYIIAPKSNDLMHYGKGHDDNPPGRGSGRWAWGSGNGDGAKEKRKAAKEKYLTQNIKGGKDRPNVSVSEKTTSEAKKSIEGAKDITKGLKNIKDSASKKGNYSELSDSELRALVNRLTLESQADRLLSGSEEKDVLDVIDNVLDVVGGVTIVVGSIAGIASTIYTIKNKVE
jgi:hypothetical protein